MDLRRAFATLRLDATTASMEDVTKSYKKLALQFHPDKPGGDTTAFQNINEAFQVARRHLEPRLEVGVDGDEELFEYFCFEIPKHVADWLESMMREERLRAERRKEQLRRRLELERQLSRPEARQLRRLRQELQDLLHSAQMLFATAVANSTRAELNALKRAEATLDDDDLSLRLGQAEEALTQLKIRVKKEQQNAWSRQAEAAMEKQRRSEEHNQQKIKRQEEKAMREQKAEEERKDWEAILAEQRRAAEEKKAQKIKEIEERQKASKAALMLRNKEKKALAKQKKGAEKQAMKKSSRASEMHPALSCHELLARTTIDSIEEETACLEIFMELLNEEASLLAEDILAERNLKRLDAGSLSSSEALAKQKKGAEKQAMKKVTTNGAILFDIDSEERSSSIDDTRAPPTLGGKASLSVNACPKGRTIVDKKAPTIEPIISMTPEVVDGANANKENNHAKNQQTMLETDNFDASLPEDTGVKNSRVSIDSGSENGQRILDRACQEIKDVREARAQQVEGKARMAATAATLQGPPAEPDLRLSARDKAVHQYIDAYMQRQHGYVANFMALPFISPNPELPPPMQQQMLAQFRQDQQAYCDQYLLNQQVFIQNYVEQQMRLQLPCLSLEELLFQQQVFNHMNMQQMMMSQMMAQQGCPPTTPPHHGPDYNMMFGPPPFPQQCPAPAAEEKKKGSQSQAAVPGKKGFKKFAKKGGKWPKKDLVSEARLDSAENPDSALPQACAPN